MFKSDDLHNFSFKKVGSGCYKVTYTTERGDKYVYEVNDMTIIDDTIHAEIAKVSDIKHLASICRNNGTHYSKSGKLIPGKVK